VTQNALTRFLTYPIFGLADVGIGDVALALGLSVYGVASAAGLLNSHNPRGDVVGCAAVVLMTAPVLFARRSPMLAAATLAVGAAINWLLIGDLVRCGAALPAVFFVAFAIGLRCPRRQALVGLALLAVNIFCQGLSDPQLGGPAVLVFMLPIAIGFMVAGFLLRQRNEAVAGLHARTEELRQQRQRNAELAVAADRARVAGELNSYVHDQVSQMAAAARMAHERSTYRPDVARETFIGIQDAGRAALVHMRNVVADLRDDAPTQPQPVLSQLDRLLAHITRADARLRVEGDPHRLPPGVELSGYRIVEQTLLALENDPSARVDVVVDFAPDSLQLTVAGPSGRAADVRAALGAATERAALHGGTLRTEAQGTFRKTVVVLPLATGRA
jgi:hypothetical protein